MDIETFLVRAGLQYKEKRDYYALSCPKHIDRDPSLKIYKNSNWCYCFSCGFSISFLNFLKEFHDGVYSEIDQDELKRLNEIKKEKPPPTRLIVRYPAGYTTWPEPVPQLKISQAAIEHFNIGYCRYGFKDKVSVKCEKCFFFDVATEQDGFSRWIGKDGYCFFAKNRIMVPITMGKKLYSIESRDLTGKAKKKVLYPHFSKTSLTLFNYDSLDKNKPLVEVEGIKAAIRIWGDVCKNVTAIYSNRLKGEQAELFKGFKRILAIPDYGRAGDQTVGDFVDNDLPIEVVILPKIVVCKDCGCRFRGEEKKDICPECKSEKVSFGDAFDFDTLTLTNLLCNRKTTTEKLLDKLNVKEKNKLEHKR